MAENIFHIPREKIAEKLKNIIDEYDIPEKISYVTTDNAPNMKPAIRDLNNMISGDKMRFEAIEHIPCIVKTCLDYLTDEKGKCIKIIVKLSSIIKK